jgi:hypothetical protein
MEGMKRCGMHEGISPTKNKRSLNKKLLPFSREVQPTPTDQITRRVNKPLIKIYINAFMKTK